MVSGAGNGIVCKGLSAGLPMVLVPGWGEQKENAARASRLGAALTIRPQRLSNERLRSAVDRLLRDSAYRQAAHQARDGGLGLGASYAADIITNVLH
jgi:UDP:flavonoid glycosyltransferase YjiC (YdhE family)